MRSDLTCPVEIEAVAVERGEQEEEAREIVCRIEFLCLNGREADSVQMNIVCFDAQDARLGGRLVRASVHPEQGERRYAGVFVPEHVDGTVRVEASVEKVWFKDGTVWRREERNVREYTPNALPVGRELDRLRAVAGADAVGYARGEDVLWMCVCGRANPVGEEKCFKCGREREQVLREYSYQAIDSTAGRKERSLQAQTQENLRRSSEQTLLEQDRRQRAQDKKRRRARRAVALLAVVALALAAVRWGAPLTAVQLGQRRMQGGDPEGAKAAFDWVDAHWPGQFGAAQLAAQAERESVEAFIETNTEPSLQTARARAKEIEGGEGEALYERASLAYAKLLEDGGDAEAAEAVYLELPQSEEAAARLLALRYAAAEAAQERVDYPAAIEGFAALGDYEDAADRREECVYLYGRQLLREGHYQEAADQFLLVSGREDAVELTRRSYYALAGEREEQGDAAAAAALYEQLGVYEDAEERARACRYEAGMAALEDGRLEEAAEQLEAAKGHEDADARYEEVVSTLGARAMEADDPQQAVDWFSKLSPTPAAQEALSGASYALAERQAQEGNLAQAAQTFATLGDYADARERADALEYDIACSTMDASPEDALARFELLGDYKDAPERALRCRSLIAQAAYASGDYEQALDLYEALGDYGDAPEQALRSRYHLAGQRSEAGAYDEAAALYEACGAYLDAEDLALRARYGAADALERSGEHQQAARAFGALGSYDDAPARASAAQDAWLGGRYASAHMDMELGDYESVIEELEGFVDEDLPERYADIPQLYADACLARADALIAQRRPLDALPVLERIADEPQAQERLEANVYKLVGTWETAAGARYVFRRDGTCDLNGREAYYGGSGYDIFAGDEPYPTKSAYGFVSLRGKTLTLRDRETDALLRLSYVGEPLDLVDAPEGEPADEPKEATASEPENEPVDKPEDESEGEPQGLAGDEPQDEPEGR